VDDEFFSLAFTAGDEAVLSGFSVSQSDLYFHALVMKFDINGSPVTGFGNNGTVILGTVPFAVGNDLLIQPDGKIVVTGALGDAPPGNSDWALWRLNADGSMDNTFGTNGVTTTDFYGNADEALALAFTQDKIIVAGKTRNSTNQMDFVVARYTNDITASITETPQKSDYSVLPNPVSQGTQLEIKYEIRQTSNVTLEMLNMTGSSVAIIPLGIQAAGNHTYQLSIPYNIKSGVYYLRMSGPQYPLWVEKIVVID
jgi:uncharacterized delta-60 repeat protein